MVLVDQEVELEQISGERVVKNPLKDEELERLSRDFFNKIEDGCRAAIVITVSDKGDGNMLVVGPSGLVADCCMKVMVDMEQAIKKENAK